MAKQAFTEILEAENEAERILAEAREKAAVLLETHEAEREKCRQEQRMTLLAETSRIRREAEEQAEKEAQPLLAEAQAEVDKLGALPRDRFEAAVDLVVQTLTGSAKTGRE
ncbi:MAG: hypothetical protein MSC43_05465 [Clostridiales bacterium]|nr:hypothetical protein [Clostridiales bacterium]MDD7432658.1 hypothetical protein [Clostridiales bacterium]MDY3060890.1 hypothetical protein [Eubacteriales bacterium]